MFGNSLIVFGVVVVAVVCVVVFGVVAFSALSLVILGVDVFFCLSVVIFDVIVFDITTPLHLCYTPVAPLYLPLYQSCKMSVTHLKYLYTPLK